jgi:mRNA interferase RelE/StbE
MSRSPVRVKLARSAGKQLQDLPGEIQRRVIAALRAIGEDPNCGTRLLGAFAGSRRYRVGNYRIVYQVREEEDLILVENIRHRGRAHRRR